MLHSDSRSKSYGGEHAEAYTNTVNDIRRLRSTRLDKQLGNSSRRARQSRIIEGPEADSVRPGSAGANEPKNRRSMGHFKIVEDRDLNGETSMAHSFGDDKVLTLDDIPRIVAAEQAREQRPNAFKHQKPGQYPGGLAADQPKLFSGHQRDLSGDRIKDMLAAEPIAPAKKRYFSELTALDYFIVRHIAVLNIEPLVQGHFNLEELLGLIESNNKKTFWGKFKLGNAGDKKKPVKKKGLFAIVVSTVIQSRKLTKSGVFGLPLELLCERDGAESALGVGPGSLRIPSVVDDAIQAMRQMGISPPAILPACIFL